MRTQMFSLFDLSDERRPQKPWLPADDRDVTNGLVVLRKFTSGFHPACIRHGAMHRVHPTEPIYRCSEKHCGVGARRGKPTRKTDRPYTSLTDEHLQPVVGGTITTQGTYRVTEQSPTVNVPQETPIVYVLETGWYDSWGLRSIHRTPESAMAAWPKGTWERVEDGYWRNGTDGIERADDSATISVYEVHL